LGEKGQLCSTARGYGLFQSATSTSLNSPIISAKTTAAVVFPELRLDGA